jgi:predicted AlkP superfamily pyrophosphatase or phosphodiesterase
MRLPFRHGRRDAARQLLLILLLLALVVPASLAGVGASARQRRGEGARRAPQVSTRKPAKPRLVLLIAVDQFRYDYLERFGELFAENGLRRLVRDGASWTDANYDHIPTETAPGHATMLTGAWPSETGIISNEWFDRATSRLVANAQDFSVSRLGGKDPDPISSPRALLCSTLGDELKQATGGRSKVIGVSLKDRAAMLPAGRMADAAYWYSTQTGEFISSTYYFPDRPKWVKEFNEERRADKYFNEKRSWTRLLSNDDGKYERLAGRDDAPWEKLVGHDGAATWIKITGSPRFEFPYDIYKWFEKTGPDFYEALTFSPFSNEMLLAFAERAITNEHLGEDSDTDVLTVSFSANDIVGHRYGPYSQELMDMTLRVDRQIGELLDFIDKDAKIGLQNTVVIFTADHGVALVPEHAVSLKQSGGRVQISDIMAAVRKSVRERFGKAGDRDTTARYVQTFSNGEIYFDQFALKRDGIRPEEIERVAGEAALKVEGVSRYFTRTQLLRGAFSPTDAVARRALHGFNPARSGDVVVVQKENWYLVGDKTRNTPVATHGAPYSYDTHVPVIIMGGGVARGLYRQSATPADIAPTLAAMLGVRPPSGAKGRVLNEALK